MGAARSRFSAAAEPITRSPEGRWDYGALGTVTNLAARLCGEANGGQMLGST